MAIPKYWDITRQRGCIFGLMLYGSGICMLLKGRLLISFKCLLWKQAWVHFFSAAMLPLISTDHLISSFPLTPGIQSFIIHRKTEKTSLSFTDSSHPSGTRNSAKETVLPLRKKGAVLQYVDLEYSFNIHQKTCTKIVRATLIIPQNPSIHQMDKKKEYCSAIKKNKLLIHRTT